MLHNLPQQYRADAWVLALADAVLGVLEDHRRQAQSVPVQLSLDTITWALEIEERQCGIIPPAGAAIESRRSALMARMRSSGRVSIRQIQEVADAWRNGEVTVSFPGGRIQVQFVGSFGVPKDLEGLKAAVELVIPAHLPVDYLFRYLLIRDIHGEKMLAEMDALPLNQFAGGDT